MTSDTEHPSRVPADDSGEDYSYDLAHEVPEAVRNDPGEARRSAPTGEAPVDQTGDYSYDLAHEVPPA